MSASRSRLPSIYYLFTLIMLPIEDEMDLSRAQSSLAFSLALLVEGLLAYSVGRWLDRGHERLVMTAGSVLLGLCLLAHSIVTTKLGFYVAWCCIGAGMAVVERLAGGGLALHWAQRLAVHHREAWGGCAMT